MMVKSKSLAGAAGLLMVLALLAGCGSPGVKLDDVPPPAAQANSERGTGTAVRPADQGVYDPRAVQPVDTTRDALNDPNSPLARRSVYFDLDSFVVKPEYQGVVEAHARFLNSSRNRRVLIQGHTDERGTSEYNLALGQKRAEAVRRSMALLGVSDEQMEAISFGKEKPKATGRDEASWAENRRVDIAY